MLKLALLLLAAGNPQQFDLACSGTLKSDSFYGGKTTEPYNTVYRIDLTARKWCADECKGLLEVADVQPTRLYLRPEVKVDTPHEYSYSSSWIDRETGEESSLRTSGRGTSILIMEWKARCEKRPFSGFPEFKTKF